MPECQGIPSQDDTVLTNHETTNRTDSGEIPNEDKGRMKCSGAILTIKKFERRSTRISVGMDRLSFQQH